MKKKYQCKIIDGDIEDDEDEDWTEVEAYHSDDAASEYLEAEINNSAGEMTLDEYDVRVRSADGKTEDFTVLVDYTLSLTVSER